MKGSVNVVLAALAIPILTSARTIGPCYQFPGADTSDCLQLIANNINNVTTIPCHGDPGSKRASIYLRKCAIVTACPDSEYAAKTVEVATAVRLALTAIGSCALSVDGSTISGYYDAADGSKTCYLDPERCVLYASSVELFK